MERTPKQLHYHLRDTHLVAIPPVNLDRAIDMADEFEATCDYCKIQVDAYVKRIERRIAKRRASHGFAS
jgi:hypothetical protein